MNDCERCRAVGWWNCSLHRLDPPKLVNESEIHYLTRVNTAPADDADASERLRERMVQFSIDSMIPPVSEWMRDALDALAAMREEAGDADRWESIAMGHLKAREAAEAERDRLRVQDAETLRTCQHWIGEYNAAEARCRELEQALRGMLDLYRTLPEQFKPPAVTQQEQNAQAAIDAASGTAAPDAFPNAATLEIKPNGNE